MASVYVLYSSKFEKFYIGSCKDFNIRFEEHRSKKFTDSFTSKTNDWILFHKIDDLNYEQARKIELHIKKMKSKKYISDLKLYKEINLKLIEKYSADVS